MGCAPRRALAQLPTIRRDRRTAVAWRRVPRGSCAGLVFTLAWEETGERGLETVVTVMFTEERGKTRMVMHQIPFQPFTERDGHDEGWNSTFDRLNEYLNS